MMTKNQHEIKKCNFGDDDVLLMRIIIAVVVVDDDERDIGLRSAKTLGNFNNICKVGILCRQNSCSRLLEVTLLKLINFQ